MRSTGLPIEGQIEGGSAQGLGLALMEEIQMRDGVIVNASFTDYLVPTFLDMPPVVSDLVEVPEPEAPYGVKGVGEPPTRRLHAPRSSPRSGTRPASSSSAFPCARTTSWAFEQRRAMSGNGKRGLAAPRASLGWI